MNKKQQHKSILLRWSYHKSEDKVLTMSDSIDKTRLSHRINWLIDFINNIKQHGTTIKCFKQTNRQGRPK